MGDAMKSEATVSAVAQTFALQLFVLRLAYTGIEHVEMLG